MIQTLDYATPVRYYEMTRPVFQDELLGSFLALDNCYFLVSVHPHASSTPLMLIHPVQMQSTIWSALQRIVRTLSALIA